MRCGEAAAESQFSSYCKGSNCISVNYNNNHLSALCNLKHKTHKRLIKSLFPDLDPDIAEKVDKIMDNPEFWMPRYFPELGHVPGLSHRGHRKYGHDLFTAAIIGIEEGRMQGLIAALMHLGADAGRDLLIKKYGVDEADIIEALINLCYKLKRDKEEYKS
jgi:hypothetical protein